MQTVENVSYFRKPWDYGARDARGEYGRLQVDPDKLVVVAHYRKKVGGLAEAAADATGIVGAVAGVVVNAVTRDGKPAEEYRIEIPKASIRRIRELPAGMGVSYNVELTDGTTDQLDVVITSRKDLLAALTAHDYPVVTAGPVQKLIIAGVVIGIVIWWMASR